MDEHRESITAKVKKENPNETKILGLVGKEGGVEFAKLST